MNSHTHPCVFTLFYNLFFASSLALRVDTYSLSLSLSLSLSHTYTAIPFSLMVLSFRFRSLHLLFLLQLSGLLVFLSSSLFTSRSSRFRFFFNSSCPAFKLFYSSFLSFNLNSSFLGWGEWRRSFHAFDLFMFSF